MKLIGGGDDATLVKFSQVLPLVLKHAVLQDFQALMFSKEQILVCSPAFSEEGDQEDSC